MAIPTKNTPIKISDLNSNFIDVVESNNSDASVTVKLKDRSGGTDTLFTYSENDASSGNLVTAEGARDKLGGLSPQTHTHDLSDIGPWDISISQDNVITFKELNLSKWQEVSNTKFTSSSIWSVCYGGGRYIAGDVTGKIAYSFDGVEWTLASRTGISGYVNDICYGNGKYVAVSSNGHIAYSDDGETWTIDHLVSGGLSSVCYGEISGLESCADPHVYVAGGSGGTIVRFTDGGAWSTRKSLLTNDVLDICFGGGKFIAVGASGMMSYSYDGITWKSINTASYVDVFPFTYDINSICYGHNGFVAVGAGGKVAHSLDGFVWTAVPNPPFGNYSIDSVYYGSGRYVAAYTSHVAYSSDGITWTLVNDPKVQDLVSQDVCYGRGKFLAVGRDLNNRAKMMYSL